MQTTLPPQNMASKVIMNDDAFFNKGFLISTDKNLLDIAVIHHFLDQLSYWGNGISLQTVETSIQNSLCFGIYQNQKQVGFARVVTDFATFAYLCDVFVLPDYRKHGLSKWLLQTIISDPQLQNLRRFMLATADAQNLYRQFGFSVLKQGERWMEIFTPRAVKKEENA